MELLDTLDFENNYKRKSLKTPIFIITLLLLIVTLIFLFILLNTKKNKVPIEEFKREELHLYEVTYSEYTKSLIDDEKYNFNEILKGWDVEFIDKEDYIGETNFEKKKVILSKNYIDYCLYHEIFHVMIFNNYEGDIKNLVYKYGLEINKDELSFIKENFDSYFFLNEEEMWAELFQRYMFKDESFVSNCPRTLKLIELIIENDFSPK